MEATTKIAAAAGVENRSRADEADAGNDLRGDARVVAAECAAQFAGENGKQRRAKADEHVCAQPGRPALEFALQSNEPAQHGRQQQARQIVLQDRPAYVRQKRQNAVHLQFNYQRIAR